MKKRANLLVVSAVILALIVGFMIGISVEYPRVKEGHLSGTIGKVKNYRNTKASEADIELKDELLADTALLNSLRNYLSFHYVRAVTLGEHIDFAVKEARDKEVFNSQNAAYIAALDDYGNLLATGRKNMLMTIAVCKSASEVSPALLRQSIIETNNLIAQINYGNKSVLGFISKLDAFIQEKGAVAYPGLSKAHDLLALNEAGSLLLTKDKALIRYFNKKKLYSKDLTAPGVNLNNVIRQDIETLALWYSEALSLSVTDAERPRALDQEKLGYFDTEKLELIGADAENLEGIGALDSEQLAMIDFEDAETLRRIFDAEQLRGLIMADAGKLGLSDGEKLGAVAQMDGEKLEVAADAENLGLLDGEKLGMGFYDAEKLGAGFTDAELLGTGFTDTEKLGGSLWDSEKLGTFLDNEILGVPGSWDYNENP